MTTKLTKALIDTIFNLAVGSTEAKTKDQLYAFSNAWDGYKVSVLSRAKNFPELQGLSSDQIVAKSKETQLVDGVSTFTDAAIAAQKIMKDVAKNLLSSSQTVGLSQFDFGGRGAVKASSINLPDALAGETVAAYVIRHVFPTATSEEQKALVQSLTGKIPDYVNGTKTPLDDAQALKINIWFQEDSGKIVADKLHDSVRDGFVKMISGYSDAMAVNGWSTSDIIIGTAMMLKSANQMGHVDQAQINYLKTSGTNLQGLLSKIPGSVADTAAKAGNAAELLAALATSTSFSSMYAAVVQNSQGSAQKIQADAGARWVLDQMFDQNSRQLAASIRAIDAGKSTPMVFKTNLGMAVCDTSTGAIYVPSGVGTYSLLESLPGGGYRLSTKPITFSLGDDGNGNRTLSNSLGNNLGNWSDGKIQLLDAKGGLREVSLPDNLALTPSTLNKIINTVTASVEGREDARNLHITLTKGTKFNITVGKFTKVGFNPNEVTGDLGGQTTATIEPDVVVQYTDANGNNASRYVWTDSEGNLVRSIEGHVDAVGRPSDAEQIRVGLDGAITREIVSLGYDAQGQSYQSGYVYLAGTADAMTAQVSGFALSGLIGSNNTGLNLDSIALTFSIGATGARTVTDVAAVNGSPLDVEVQRDLINAMNNIGAAERNFTEADQDEATYAITEKLHNLFQNMEVVTTGDGATKVILKGIPQIDLGGGTTQTISYNYDSQNNITARVTQLVYQDQSSARITDYQNGDSVGVFTNSTGKVATANTFLNNGVLTRDTVSQIGDVTIDLRYVADGSGNWVMESVLRIDGVEPHDSDMATKALIHSGYNPLTGENETEAKTIIYAISNDPDATLTDVSNPNQGSWWNEENINRLGSSISSVQGLLAALKTGDSLAIASSSVHLLNIWDSNPSINDWDSALNAAEDLLSLKHALDRGDKLVALRSGLSLSNTLLTEYKTLLSREVLDLTAAVGAGAGEATSSALSASAQNLEVVSKVLDGVQNVLPFVSAAISLRNGDTFGAILAVASYFVPAFGWFFAIANIVGDLFADTTSIGESHLEQFGPGSVLHVSTPSGSFGGDQITSKLMKDLLKQVQDFVLEYFPDDSFVAERMPTVSYFDGILTISYRDQITGKKTESRFDQDGILISQGVGQDQVPGAKTDDFFKGIAEIFVESAMKAGAIVPHWVSDTAQLQHLYGDSFDRRGKRILGTAGKSTVDWAIKDGNLLASASTAITQSMRPIVLDLNGNGIETTSQAQGYGVLFDVDNDGFAEHTDWIDPHDGILVLDYDGNGEIDNGHELFNDVGIDTAKRGLDVLKEIDVNHDKKLTNVDPAFAHLQVWRDLNLDGVAQDYELSSLVSLGITQLDFATGNFIQDGNVRHFGVANLSAETEGVQTKATKKTLFVTQEDQSVESFAIVVTDQTLVVDGMEHGSASSDSMLYAGYDLINGSEDISIVVNAAQLLANDSVRAVGLDHASLKITSVTALSGGTVVLDVQTGAIKFTPDANFFGDALFAYSVTDGVGRAAQGEVTVNLFSVNDLPETENSSIIERAVLASEIFIAATEHPEHAAYVTGFVHGEHLATTATNIAVIALESYNDATNRLGPTQLYIGNEQYEIGQSADGSLFARGKGNNQTLWYPILTLDKFAGKILGSDVESGSNLIYTKDQDPHWGTVTIDPVTGVWKYVLKAGSSALLSRNDAFVIKVEDTDGGASFIKVIIGENGAVVDTKVAFLRTGVGASNSNHAGASQGIGGGGGAAGSDGATPPRRDPLAFRSRWRRHRNRARQQWRGHFVRPRCRRRQNRHRLAGTGRRLAGFGS